MRSEWSHLDLLVAERLDTLYRTAEREHLDGGTPLFNRIGGLLHTAKSRIARQPSEATARPVETTRPAHG